LYIDYTTYSKYFQPKFSKESKLEEALFEFSNQIGAYITYLFILLSDPKNEIIFPSSPNKGNVNSLIGLVWNADKFLV
jgi:hypothetical protein